MTDVSYEDILDHRFGWWDSEREAEISSVPEAELRKDIAAALSKAEMAGAR